MRLVKPNNNKYRYNFVNFLYTRRNLIKIDLSIKIIIIIIFFELLWLIHLTIFIVTIACSLLLLFF